MSLLLKGDVEADAARRTKWLANRRKYVTSTDVPILFGQGYAGSSRDRLYGEKVGIIEPTDLSGVDRVELGRLFQPSIVKVYEKHVAPIHVIPADEYALHVSEKYPWLAASLDAMDSEGRITEIKNHHAYLSDVADIPTGWIIQVNTQMLVMDTNKARLVICCAGSEVRWFDIEPDAELQAEIVKRSREFWNMVENLEVPPPVEPDDNDGLTLLYRYLGQGEKSQVLSADYYDMGIRRQELKDHLKQVEAEIDMIEAKVKYALGSSEVGYFEDYEKARWTWKTTTRKDGAVYRTLLFKGAK